MDSETLTEENVASRLGDADGVIIPGGFGNRGIEGMVLAAKYARESNVPYLGICLGMQIAVIEFCRNVCGIKDANSGEFDAPPSMSWRPFSRPPISPWITISSLWR